jgi:hypothetical protein
MVQRSFRLEPDEVELERVLFEAYGFVDGSTTDKYRNLIKFLTEHLRKTDELIPKPKYEKPNCTNLTEPETGKYHCVFRRENKPPLIEKNLHLIDCASCKQQEGKPKQTPQPQIQPIPKLVNSGGEISSIQHKQQLTPVVHQKFTPNPAFDTTVVNYTNDKMQRVCPFIHDTKNWLVYYEYACKTCRKETPDKSQACVNLCRTLREKLIVTKALAPNLPAINTQRD